MNFKKIKSMNIFFGEAKTYPTSETIEMEFRGRQFFMFCGIFERKGDSYLKVSPKDVGSFERTVFKYLLGNRNISNSIPENLEFVFSEIEEAFEPIKDLLKRYQYNFSFHSNDENSKTPITIHTDIEKTNKLLESFKDFLNNEPK